MLINVKSLGLNWQAALELLSWTLSSNEVPVTRDSILGI